MFVCVSVYVWKLLLGIAEVTGLKTVAEEDKSREVRWIRCLNSFTVARFKTKAKVLIYCNIFVAEGIEYDLGVLSWQLSNCLITKFLLVLLEEWLWFFLYLGKVLTQMLLTAGSFSVCREQFYTPPEPCSLGTVDHDLQIFASHVRLRELNRLFVCALLQT